MQKGLPGAAEIAQQGASLRLALANRHYEPTVATNSGWLPGLDHHGWTIHCCQVSQHLDLSLNTESAVWSKTYIRWEFVFITCDSKKMQLRLHCEKCKHWVERKCVTELR